MSYSVNYTMDTVVMEHGAPLANNKINNQIYFSTNMLPLKSAVTVLCQIKNCQSASLKNIYVYPSQGNFGEIFTLEHFSLSEPSYAYAPIGSKIYMKRSLNGLIIMITQVKQENENIVMDIQSIPNLQVECKF